MTCSRRAVAAILIFWALLAVENSGHAAQQEITKCTAQLRKCNSHCNLVYESKRANRVCRDRCKDAFYVCKAQPN